MSWGKFKLLLWKNLTIQKRHPIGGIFEIIFPICLSIILACVRDLVQPTTEPLYIFNKFQPMKYEESGWLGKNITFAYSPASNPAICQLAERFIPEGFDTEKFNSSKKLEEFLLKQTNFTAGIDFGDKLADKDTLPSRLNYTIRLPNYFRSFQDLYPFVSLNRQFFDTSNETESMYNQACFITIQNEVDRAFMTIVSDNKMPPTTSLRKFPFPSVSYDYFLDNFAIYVFPIFVVISFLYTTKTIIKNVAMERENQMKETLKIMGLTSVHYWLAWFVKSLLMLLLPLVFMVLILTTSFLTNSGSAVFMHSNPFLILIFLTVHLVSSINFCFLISVMFKKSSTAASVGAIVYFFSFIPYYSLHEKFAKFGYFTKLMFCLLLNSGMGQGIAQILRLELGGEGLQFSNFFKRSADIDFSFGEVFLMMVYAAIVHLLLMIYIDQVFPGEYGVPKKWNFPFTACVKLCRGNKVETDDDYSSINSEVFRSSDPNFCVENFEEEPLDLKAGIQVANLCKQFGTKLAVNKLNLNMYEGQITVLLGHNGAGKTTTMSILTGMIPPSYGTAYINSRDIRYHMDETRASIGICPQHNILFDELTVEEHFRFFCRLKGFEDYQQIANETNRYISMLEMEDKRDCQTKSLSGGTKRKLSVGIALCGNSKIVILDEPTSGMDSASRRTLWNILIEEKEKRTILFTTHLLDEADILGDRIAIMADGELKTVGSSFFLKKRFGTGYKLICEKGYDCDPFRILDLLREFVPDAKMESDSFSDVTYIISEENLPKFREIFKSLEDNSDELDIVSFGCSLTTLEEVFLKIGSDAFDTSTRDSLNDDNVFEDATSIDFDQIVPSSRVTGFSLLIYQFEATILKKFCYLRRNYAPIIWYAFLSVWLIFILLAEPIVEFVEPESLYISLDSYKDTKTFLEIETLDKDDSLPEAYRGLFSGKNTIIELDNQTMNEVILEKYNESYAVMGESYIIGVTLNDSDSTAWFNPRFPHALPLTVNLLNRAVLKHVAGDKFDIFVVNKPYKLKDENENEERRKPTSPNVIIVLFLFHALLSYWPGIFVAFYIKERECRSKLLQFICGANQTVYWISSFLFDFTIFLLIMSLLLFKVAIYDAQQFRSFEDLSHFLIIFGCYGLSMLPFLYLYSFLFSKHSSAEMLVPVICIATAILYSVAGAIYMANPKDELLRDTLSLVYYISLLFPPANLIDTFKKMMYILSALALAPATPVYNIDNDGIGLNLVMFAVSGVVYLTICILIDYRVLKSIFDRLFNKKVKFPTRSIIDDDIQAENDKVNLMTESEIANSNLVVKNLSKFYGNFLAVNQLCLAIEPAECFGLLGINGAGKTTTFKMLTGDECSTSGDAFIRGASIKNAVNKANKMIGYCPQFDALLMDLTGRETLMIFCLIRGIPQDEMETVYSILASDLGFLKYLDKQVKVYSGGNKRKLGTALAMLGDSNLIFLDEPTSGIDPGARRQLWNVVNKAKNSGRSVVLTSHSMEECEALCSRVAIMVAGQIKCLGSTQHLKNKFSKGSLILTVKTGRESLESEDKMVIIKHEIKQLFPYSDLKEQYLDILTYHLPEIDLKWSEIFGLMEQLKNVMGIDDYSLTQTSLEQVFLFFAKSGVYQRQTNASV